MIVAAGCAGLAFTAHATLISITTGTTTDDPELALETVPEPSAAVLLALASALLLVRRRRE